jgi:predicted helicase
MQIETSLLNDYFKNIKKEYSTRNYTEFSFRTPFENFIKSLDKDYDVHQEQKRMRGVGAPDFKAFRKAVNVGYIETKDLGLNLDEIIKTEQLGKYIRGIDNLILTNYCQFILIRKGENIFNVNLFDITDLHGKDIKFNDDVLDRFQKLIDNFFGFKYSTIKSAPELARELSKKARLLKDIAKDQLEDDLKILNDGGTPSPVYNFYTGIQELIRDINIDDAADAYAQTITYGIFLAKTHHHEKIERANLITDIPESIALIRMIVMNILFNRSAHLDIVWIIEDIIDILNATEIEKILSDIDERGKKDKDPFLFFYEDFLQLYDPEKRKHFGEYYTPRPVVNFIVNVTNQILKDDFDKPKGLAEDGVTILDPGVGTGTFLWITYLLTFKELKDHGLKGVINQKIREHILKDFYGFEISIISYIIAHLKLTTLLGRWGYIVKNDERVQVYLTNTLERNETHSLLPFMQELSQESIKAGKIKEKPILAIIGNPPYHGLSANKGEWINELLKEGYERADGSKDDGYYKVDGKSLGEANPKWLQDDYVKFIRFAQWKIDKSGQGILAFINNHAYIDNPTFRGMRESLLQSFNRIYILNLHGNARQKEKCPDGTKDENVFDIQQGVAINIFVKNKKFTDTKVFYANLWGHRNFKFEWLDKLALDSPNWLKTINWQEVKTKSPEYYFIPRDYSCENAYNKYVKITEIFPLYSAGIVTARDDFTIKFKPEDVWTTISEFIILDPEVARKKYTLRNDVRDWKVNLAQKDVLTSGKDKEKIIPLLYRPFDTRYTYYTGNSRGFHCMPRSEVMNNMFIKDNIGLITVRKAPPNSSCNYFFISDKIISNGVIRSDNQSIDTFFPLYRYNQKGQKEPNLSTTISDKINKLYSKSISSEEILFYTYAVLYSLKYREKFSESLKSDFPRIPFVENYQLFKKLSVYGKELVDLHLMKTQFSTETKFEVQGSNIIKVVKYDDGKIYINTEQYFEGVPNNIWDFFIGGYQVLDKWLKSHKNRELSGTEIEQFLQIIEIIKKTIEIMIKIDETNFLDNISSTL